MTAFLDRWLMGHDLPNVLTIILFLEVLKGPKR